MELIEVQSESENILFHQTAAFVYEKDKNYIPHLKVDIDSIFKNAQGKYLKRWVIVENFKPVGRIAAFTSEKDSSGGLGFFECINDPSFAHRLFKTGVDWLKSQNITNIQAPINFGERDKFWGLLVDGFWPGSYQENYNPPYYQKLFESFGFLPSFKQITYALDISTFDGTRIEALFKRVQSNSHIHFKSFENKDLIQFSVDFAAVYNLAWQNKEGFSSLTADRVQELFKSMKPVIQNNLIWMAYADQVPVGFFVNILEINYALKELNGSKNIWRGIRYLFKRMINPPDTTRGIVFGIVPSYQNKGIDVGLIYHFYKEVKKEDKIDMCLLSWIGDFNPKMISLMKALGARSYKIHTTYCLNT